MYEIVTARCVGTHEEPRGAICMSEVLCHNKGWLTYSADSGITLDTTSNISSTCIVLALVTGLRDCQNGANSQ